MQNRSCSEVRYADWFRYNAETWFVATNTPSVVQDAVQKVLSTNDSVLVTRIDPYDAHGWAPPEMWNWLSTKKDPLVNAQREVDPGNVRNILPAGL